MAEAPAVDSGMVRLLCRIVVLGILVAQRNGPGIDLELAEQVQALPDTAGDVLRVASYAGGNWRPSLLILALSVLFFWRGQRAEALLIASAQIPRLGQEVAKLVFDAPRPSVDLVTVHEVASTAAYPSGHVVSTTIVFVLLFLLTPHIWDDGRLVWPVRAFCVALVLAVPVARVWLGAHWPSDCLGGYLFAALWLVPALLVYKAVTSPAASARGGVPLTR